MGLSRLQQYINWILPIILSVSIYTIIYISGHFEPEIFSFQIIITYAILIAFAFFLIRKYLAYVYKITGVNALNWTTFIKALLIVIVVIISLLSINKLLLIALSPQSGSIDTRHISVYFAQSTIFAFAIVGIQYMLLYFEAWNKSNLRSERLVKENTKARIESLKLQLSPHFLFNNLNTLDGLIQENQKEASTFLLELSSLYRGILKHVDEEIIPLKDEVALTHHFIFLMKKRFGENFNCKIDISKSSLQSFYVPPMSIQLLIENAIKHNKIDDVQPLDCSVKQKDNFLIIQNTLNPKQQKQKTSGIGLKNLKSRYKLLSDELVSVEQRSNKYTVSIPLLKVQSK